MKPQTIFRVAKNPDNPYVMIDKRPVENPLLSWKAKGVLTYLVSRPDNWEVRIEDICNRSTDGEYAVRGAIRELRKAGHVQYQREVGPDGKVVRWVIFVYEVPHRDNREVVLPHRENREVVREKPHRGNRASSNTKKDTNKERGAQARRGGFLKPGEDIYDKFKLHQHGYLEWFMKATGLTPYTYANFTSWSVAFNEWHGRGILIEDLDNALSESEFGIRGGFAVTEPRSLSKTAAKHQAMRVRLGTVVQDGNVVGAKKIINPVGG